MPRLSCWRAALAALLPPLAVADRGCGAMLLVALLTLVGWLPGVMAALALLLLDGAQPQAQRAASSRGGRGRPAERQGAFIRLSDGDVAQVVQDDGAPLDLPPAQRWRSEQP